CLEDHDVDILSCSTVLQQQQQQELKPVEDKKKTLRALKCFVRSLSETAKTLLAKHLAGNGKNHGFALSSSVLARSRDMGSRANTRVRAASVISDITGSSSNATNGLSSPVTMPSTPLSGYFGMKRKPTTSDIFSISSSSFSFSMAENKQQNGSAKGDSSKQLITPSDTETDEHDTFGFDNMGFDQCCYALRMEIRRVAQTLPIEALEPLRAYLIAEASKSVVDNQQQQQQQQRGNPYYRSMHHTAGMFTGFGIFGLGFALVTTSTIFAAIRRATGLTFRRQIPWPPFNVETSEKLLQWYDSRLDQINEKAEERISFIISKYADEIEDPNIRQVWETHIREDVMEKVERIRERRRVEELLRDDGQSGTSRSRGPGNNNNINNNMTPSQQLLNDLRSLHDIKESVSCPGESSIANGGNGSTSTSDTRNKGIDRIGNEGNKNTIYSHNNSVRSSPMPYIATAATAATASVSSEAIPEPSAPLLSESEYLRISSRPYTTDAEYYMPDTLFSASASTSRNPQRSQVV
ncbi:hypothetical protein J3B02_004432, partial [Coemansia erecta]